MICVRADDAIRPQVLLEQGRDSSRRSVSVAIHDEPCPVWPPLQQLQQQQQDSWQQASQEELEGAVGGVGISDVEVSLLLLLRKGKEAVGGVGVSDVQVSLLSLPL